MTIKCLLDQLSITGLLDVSNLKNEVKATFDFPLMGRNSVYEISNVLIPNPTGDVTIVLKNHEVNRPEGHA